jgi:predicted transcriptional regulator
MPTTRTGPGGDLEYAVLAFIWERKQAAAPEIHAGVGEPAGLVYTTIAKVLDRLHEKGLVSRRRDGRSYVYRARVERADVDRARTRDAISRIVATGPVPAIANLVDAVEALDPKLLDQLARVVEERRRRRRRGT